MIFGADADDAPVGPGFAIFGFPEGDGIDLGGQGRHGFGLGLGLGKGRPALRRLVGRGARRRENHLGLLQKEEEQFKEGIGAGPAFIPIDLAGPHEGGGLDSGFSGSWELPLPGMVL